VLLSSVDTLVGSSDQIDGKRGGEERRKESMLKKKGRRKERLSPFQSLLFIQESPLTTKSFCFRYRTTTTTLTKVAVAFSRSFSSSSSSFERVSGSSSSSSSSSPFLLKGLLAVAGFSTVAYAFASNKASAAETGFIRLRKDYL